ncbi:MAG TPA: hypothetical protein VHZ03_23620 [Trebonia sp.]|nr:hypothetical protein [Trebonia sp.]
MPTCDEVRPVGTEPGPGEILDTNSVMLAEQAREAGCDYTARVGAPPRLWRATSGAPLVSG